MMHAIEQFFAAWGDTDADSRATTLCNCLPTDLTYLDPRTPEPISDLDELIGYVGMFSQYAPGATAKVVDLSETSGHFRATVEFGMPDGTAQLGQYFITLDDQSRAARLVGFAGSGVPE